MTALSRNVQRSTLSAQLRKLSQIDQAELTFDGFFSLSVGVPGSTEPALNGSRMGCQPVAFGSSAECSFA